MTCSRTLAVTFLVLFAASVALAGGAQKAWLTRPADGPDDDAKGFVKIKVMKKTGDLHLLEVMIAAVDAGDYDVFIGGEDVGDLTVAEGDDSGKWKVNAKRGDEFDGDPAGETVEVKDAEGNVVLSGTVPEPGAEKMKPASAKAKLEAPEEGADEDAKGMVMAKGGAGAEILQILVTRVAPGTYDVFVADAEGTLTDVGDLVVEEGEASGKWMVVTKRGDGLPFDADSVADLAGRAFEVRNESGDTVVEGEIPDIAAKGKGKGKGREK